MTFRIERSVTEHAVVLTVSGDIGIADTPDVRALLEEDFTRPVVLALEQVAVVDRAGVQLLAECELRGATLANCPGYVREWIEREKELRMASTETATIGEGTFAGVGGLKIFFRSWRPSVEARGVVAIVPGFNAHSGYYDWVANELVARRLAVYAVDLRGRGKSDGERFYVEKFTDYVTDVATFVSLAKSRESGLPLFLLGHSAGGVVSCMYAIDHQAELAGLICESFAFKVPAPDFALAVFKGLSHIAPHAHVLRLKNEDFSSDPKVVDAMNADPLIAHETQPTQTLAEMVRADERLEKSFSAMTLPLLILHGTADKATKPSGSQFFYDTAGSKDKTLKLYEGGFHDLLNDLDKRVVMTDITAWIDGRLSTV